MLSNITLLVGNVLQSFNLPIASVIIDTTCLCNPKLSIDFTGILTVTPLTGIALSTFTFSLFRICEGSSSPQAVDTFNLDYKNLFTALPVSDTLIFKYSPCDYQCKDCSGYILELTSVSNASLLTANISITATLFALAVES